MFIGEIMKLAIIGSRTLTVEGFEAYLPEGVTEIVSGGAKGVDQQAAAYAMEKQIPLTEFLPDYKAYGRGAPHKRNQQIADYADMALAFWNGRSKGTMDTVSQFRKQGKPVIVITIPA
jgi:predicted Rossmann fold nucleotide-binding protein DprA/Smf involved in DNA uptake